MSKRPAEEALSDVLYKDDALPILYQRAMERKIVMNKENVQKLIDEWLAENDYVKVKK